MIRQGRLVVACLVALTVTFHPAHAGGHVYLFRGLIDVFSQGMDSMAAKLKARGISASVHAHGAYVRLAPQAAALAKSGKGPIIIVGHSYGADSTVYMANHMKELGAPVGLLVMYGPTEDHEIPSNVKQVLNYYQTQTALWQGKALPGASFRGSIKNVNLDNESNITHFNIDKIERLHAQAIAMIIAQLGAGSSPRSDAAAISAEPTANAERPGANGDNPPPAPPRHGAN